MMEKVKICYMTTVVILVLMTIFSWSEESEDTKAKSLKNDIVCKQKVLWKMRMCPDGKLVCSKNKKYVEKAKHYIKALGSDNPTRRIKASYKLMRIAPYILPYLKKEYKKAKNAEQSNALLIYKTINLLKDAELKIMCEDGKGGFMWYAVISAIGMKAHTPTGYMGLGFILVGNEKGVIGGIQVRTGTDKWGVSNYSCDLRDGSRTKFAIEISDGRNSFVATDELYYRDATIYTSFSKDCYGIVKKNHNGKYIAIIDGKESKEFDRIGEVVFNSSCSRYGFIAKKSNGKLVAVIDGKESKEYNSIIWNDSIIGVLYRPLSERRSNRYGFRIQKDKDNWKVVIDGKEIRDDDIIGVTGGIIFSFNGSRYTFWAQKSNGKWVAVIDNKESEEYDSIEEIIFSSTGKKYGFLAQKSNGKWVAVIDGKENQKYERIDRL